MKRLLHILAVLAIMAGLLAPLHVSAAGGLSVAFERIRESPVSVTFRVTVVNPAGELKDLPVDISFDGIGLNKLQGVTIEDVRQVEKSRDNPVYKSQEMSYTATGTLKVTADAEMGTGFSYTDVGKDGKALKEGYCERYDEKTKTVYWHEDVVVGYDAPTVWKETENSPLESYDKPKSATGKLTSSLSLPSSGKNDWGWGAGVRVFDITINTGLLRTADGYGSKGLMKWDVGGTVYFDDKNSSWWDTDWLYSQKITLNNSAQAENLINFPVGVFLDNSNFDFTHAQPDGDDVRFVDADGATDLDYEVVSWSYTDNGVNDDSAEIWVEAPQVDASSATDYFTMFFGNVTCANGEDVAGTWNSGYVAVYHMNDGADTSHINDSTANGNNGTKKGANEPIESAGIFGKAQSFDGSNDYISIPHKADWNFGTNPFTVEYSSYLTDTPSWQNTAIGHGYYYQGWDIWPSWGNVGIHSNSIYAGWSPANALNAWIAQAFIGDGANINLIKNGVAKGLVAYQTGWIQARTAPLTIGCDEGLGRLLKFACDEVRISNVARSAPWIAATNLTLTNAFATIGTEEGKPADPATFTAALDGNNVNLSWALPARATGMTIIRGENQIPVSLTDGIEVYDGTDLSYTDLGAGSEITTFYYSAFAYSDWGYSDEAAEAEAGGAGMTELATAVAEGMSDFTNQFQVQVAQLVGSVDTYAVLIIKLLFILTLLILAFWRREPLIYLFVSVALFLFGFEWAGIPDFFVLGIILIVLGVLSLFAAFLDGMSGRKKAS